MSISVARAGGFEWHLMTTVSIDLLPPKFSEPSNWDSIISFRWWLKRSLEYLLRGHVLDYFQRQDYVKLRKMVTDGKFYCWSKHVIRWLRVFKERPTVFNHRRNHISRVWGEKTNLFFHISGATHSLARLKITIKFHKCWCTVMFPDKKLYSKAI